MRYQRRRSQGLAGHIRCPMLLKRGLKGTYISVEPFHLDAYVAEQVFRYNNRKDADDSTRFASCLMGIQGKRLTYSEITGRGLQA